ncbi:MAG: 30S ribosomal protein S13 [Patescibacteria group bacterium]|nr:30S ribosomal protein S13 [Patescibacteria group bacterium]MDD4304333.1 30S ribosomal protein S13 [Patescibacteria group bacterium]MDD4695596.1 30S ribosomal protein S13 [Patescibacteria group bacterium]
MARIAGINLPNNKRTEIALTYVYGIGKQTSKKILEKTKVNPDTRVKDLSEEDINKLRDAVEKEHKVEGDLRREVMMNIKIMKDIKSYKGTRHAKHLPARGQRTKTNSRTVRGNKRGVATSGKKGAAQKT